LARTQVFLAFKKRGDGGVVGIDNFNGYYEISLKRSAGQDPPAKHRIFFLDVDTQQNGFLLNTVFFGAGPDHPCDASGSPSCCTLCNGESRLICGEQHCSTGE